MYMSTAFLLVGVLTLSTAGPIAEKCRDIPPKHNFVPLKYFDNNWYLTHALVGNAHMKPGDMMCVKGSADIFKNGIIREKYVAYSPVYDKFVFTENFINLDEFHGVGKYLAESRTIDQDGKPIVNKFAAIPFTVIDTDYKSYAIFYTCTEMPNGEGLSTYAVMSNVQDADKVNPQVEVVLRRLGFKLQDFTSIEGLTCKDYPEN